MMSVGFGGSTEITVTSENTATIAHNGSVVISETAALLNDNNNNCVFGEELDLETAESGCRTPMEPESVDLQTHPLSVVAAPTLGDPLHNPGSPSDPNLLSSPTSPQLSSPTSQSRSAKRPRANLPRKNAWGNLSYADLIAKAIQESEDKRMTLGQIYEWMTQNVSYFKEKADSCNSAGWKNSIRHNLSLHGRFVRIPPSQGQGKSSWWMVNPDAGCCNSKHYRKKNSLLVPAAVRSDGVDGVAGSGDGDAPPEAPASAAAPSDGGATPAKKRVRNAKGPPGQRKLGRPKGQGSRKSDDGDDDTSRRELAAATSVAAPPTVPPPPPPSQAPPLYAPAPHSAPQSIAWASDPARPAHLKDSPPLSVQSSDSGLVASPNEPPFLQLSPDYRTRYAPAVTDYMPPGSESNLAPMAPEPMYATLANGQVVQVTSPWMQPVGGVPAGHGANHGGLHASGHAAGHQGGWYAAPGPAAPAAAHGMYGVPHATHVAPVAHESRPPMPMPAAAAFGPAGFGAVRPAAMHQMPLSTAAASVPAELACDGDAAGRRSAKRRARPMAARMSVAVGAGSVGGGAAAYGYEVREVQRGAPHAQWAPAPRMPLLAGGGGPLFSSSQLLCSDLEPDFPPYSDGIQFVHYSYGAPPPLEAGVQLLVDSTVHV